jgi:hypothetical protein
MAARAVFGLVSLDAICKWFVQQQAPDPCHHRTIFFMQRKVMSCISSTTRCSHTLSLYLMHLHTTGVPLNVTVLVSQGGSYHAVTKACSSWTQLVNACSCVVTPRVTICTQCRESGQGEATIAATRWGRHVIATVSLTLVHACDVLN